MQILILEPNALVVSPYSYLASIFRQAVTVQRVETIDQGLESIAQSAPGLVLMSASYKPADTMRFLEKLKNSGVDDVVPLVWVVDLENPLSTIFGTQWAGQTAVCSTLTSLSEFKSIQMRLFEDEI